MRSPNWTVDELKLALELYLTIGSKQISKVSKKTPEIVALSTILRGLDSAPKDADEKYRSTNSIHLKLMNFHSVNNSYSGTAMSNVGALDKEIWNKHSGDISKLRKDVLIFLKNHYVGKRTDEVVNYISRIERECNVSASTSQILEGNDSFLEAAKTSKKSLRDLISKQEQSEYKDKLMRICDELDDVLDQYEKDISEENYKIHGGVNQKPVDQKDKIGIHVRNTIDKMIAENLLTSEILKNLQDSQWCKDKLRLGYPLFKLVDESKEISDQRKNKDGYLRYYKKIYEISGRKYLLCKEWFESSRKKFDSWVGSVYGSNVVDISSNELKKMLNALKKADSKKICIDVSDVMNTVDGNEKVYLDKLVEIGLLSYYQGSRTEYIVDDYDLMYDMLGNVAKYARR